MRFWLAKAWKALPQITITKCFQKAGFSFNADIQDNDDPEDDVPLSELADLLRQVGPKLAQGTNILDGLEFANVDQATETCLAPADQSSVHSVTTNSKESDSSDEDAHEGEACELITARQASQMLKQF